MDPTTWPLWVKVLAGWGPLGVWAGSMTYAYFKLQGRFEAQAKTFASVVTSLQKAHNEERTRTEDRHRGELTGVHVECRTQIIEQGDRFAADVRESANIHHDQENELVDRLTTALSKKDEVTAQLATKWIEFAESFKRRSGGDDGSST